jgi:TorA-specific chaperone
VLFTLQDPAMASAAADLCAAFADFFATPLEAADIAALRADGQLGGLAALCDGPAGQRARDVLVGCGDVPEATSTLNAAFCCLFLGAGGPHGSAPPYQSAYVGNGRLFQEPTAEMAALLASRGLTVVDGCREPPDHLAIELALLVALLNGPAPEAVSAMLDRLLGWVPAFAARCADCDTTGFYAALAEALHGYLLDQRAAILTPSESCCREMHS